MLIKRVNKLFTPNKIILYDSPKYIFKMSMFPCLFIQRNKMKNELSFL